MIGVLHTGCDVLSETRFAILRLYEERPKVRRRARRSCIGIMRRLRRLRGVKRVGDVRWPAGMPVFIGPLSPFLAAAAALLFLAYLASLGADGLPLSGGKAERLFGANHCVWLRGALIALSYVSAGLGVVALCSGILPVFRFDDASGTLRVSRFPRPAKIIPLADIDDFFLVKDFNGLAYDYFYVLAFRKDLMRPAMRVSGKRARPADLADFAAGRLSAARGALAAHRSAAPLPDSADPDAIATWRRSGRFFHRYFERPYRFLLRLATGNLLPIAILRFVETRYRDQIDLRLIRLFESLPRSFRDDDVMPYLELAWEGVYWTFLTVLVLKIVFARVSLRIDSETGTLSFSRCLGFWRTDIPFPHFDALALFSPDGKPGLYIRTRKPGRRFLLSKSASPEKLRRLLLETAAAMGIDPWDNFEAHPEPATENDNEGFWSKSRRSFRRRFPRVAERVDGTVAAHRRMVADGTYGRAMQTAGQRFRKRFPNAAAKLEKLLGTDGENGDGSARET